MSAEVRKVRLPAEEDVLLVDVMVLMIDASGAMRSSYGHL